MLVKGLCEDLNAGVYVRLMSVIRACGIYGGTELFTRQVYQVNVRDIGSKIDAAALWMDHGLDFYVGSH